jgi:hypothetical protein
MYLPVHSINYWILTTAKIPSTEKDGGFNVMSMGRNGSSLAEGFLFVNSDWHPYQNLYTSHNSDIAGHHTVDVYITILV